VEKAQETHSDLFAWHRSLADLRRTHPELSDGRLEAVRVSFDESAGWLSMNRGRISVVCNWTPTGQEIPCRTGEVLLASADGVSVGDRAAKLPGHGVVVFKVEPGGATLKGGA
jgi:maltooligosyltrehalose trehalohydrolase